MIAICEIARYYMLNILISIKETIKIWKSESTPNTEMLVSLAHTVE